MHRHTLLAVAVALAAVTFAAPRPADAGDLQLGAGVTTAYPSASSFDALSDDNRHGSGGLSVAYSLPIDHLRVYAELNSTGTERNRFDGDYHFNWQRGMYLAGVDWGPTFGGFFRPFFRVTAGYARHRLQVNPEYASNFGQTAHDFATKDSVGFELFLPMADPSNPDSPSFAFSENFTIGLTAQAGYLWQTKSDYTQMTTDAGGDWQRSGIDLGRLDASGAFWDMGVFVRFGL